jgi:hypothetical protein
MLLEPSVEIRTPVESRVHILDDKEIRIALEHILELVPFTARRQR